MVVSQPIELTDRLSVIAYVRVLDSMVGGNRGGTSILCALGDLRGIMELGTGWHMPSRCCVDCRSLLLGDRTRSCTLRKV